MFTVNGVNYFQVINPYTVLADSTFDANPGMTVSQACAIDRKMDDGLPATGNVTAAMSVSFDSKGDANPGMSGTQGSWFPATALSAASPSGSTCYDTTSLTYSISQSGGNGVNCALSFRFQ